MGSVIKTGLEWVAAFLLLAPLLYSTVIGYDHWWWRQWGRVSLLPFPSRFSVRFPIWGWYLVSWMVILYAVFRAAGQGGNFALLTLLVAIVETGYALLRRRNARRPPPETFPFAIIVFGLWHNALLEELLFRGLPLVGAKLVRAEDWTLWPFAYVLGTSSIFGMYHSWQIGPGRFCDTTLFGGVLALAALRYGLPAAILLHLIHNVLAMPTPASERSAPWWRNHWIYLALLAAVAALGEYR